MTEVNQGHLDENLAAQWVKEWTAMSIRECFQTAKDRRKWRADVSSSMSADLSNDNDSKQGKARQGKAQLVCNKHMCANKPW